MKTRLPVFFISHGGGPWPFMKEELGGEYALLTSSLSSLPQQLSGQVPRAVLVITAHWEDAIFKVQGAAHPGMIYDYYGFPAHTYQIRYPAPGDPQLAEAIVSCLRQGGLEAAVDGQRGFDHGTFTPMAVIYPNAQIPVVQMSIRRDYDVQAHIQAGRQLAPLREQGVLILGSGLSYHNLRAFGPTAQQPSAAFDHWLSQTLNEEPSTRLAQLKKWTDAPAARLAHPREDHLVPLFVALGAAENEESTRIYHESDFMGGVTTSSWRFGN